LIADKLVSIIYDGGRGVNVQQALYTCLGNSEGEFVGCCFSIYTDYDKFDLLKEG